MNLKVTLSSNRARINKFRSGLPAKSQLFNKSLESTASIPLKYKHEHIKYLAICKYIFEKSCHVTSINYY